MRPLVTFDFHNTLAICDDWFYLEIRDLPLEVLRETDPAALETVGRETILDAYRALRRQVMASGREVDAVTSVNRVLRDVGLDVDEAAVDATVDRLMRATAIHAAPVPGAVEAVRQVARAGVAVGVVSSAAYHPFLEWTLDAFGIGDSFDFVMTSASSGYYKSSPEIYRRAMATTGAKPEQSLHVGDSLRWDVWAAQQAGMSTVWFANSHTNPATNHADEATPDITVDTMVDVAPLILDQLGIA